MVRGILRCAAALAAAAAGSLAWVSPIEAEPELVRPTVSPWAAAPGLGIAYRKAAAGDDGEIGAIATTGTLFNLHTGELLPVSESEPSPEDFSRLLEDRGLQKRIDIDPRLLAMLKEFAREHRGARIDIVSGYRSPKRNEMMRKKGRRVASHSQHTRGQAVDFRVEGLTPGAIVKELEARRWDGGIGRYDSASDRFVHADVGPKRKWIGK